MNTAILVIDVQQGLCEGPGAAFDCAGTIRRINIVTRHAREVGAQVIFIQHETESLATLNMALRHGNWPKVLKQIPPINLFEKPRQIHSCGLIWSLYLRSTKLSA